MNKELTKRIENLPDDVKKYIYHAFLKDEIHYRKFRRLLETQRSRTMDICDIRPLIPNILSQPGVVHLLRKNIPQFDYVYTMYKIKGDRYGMRSTCMAKGNDFALALLYYLVLQNGIE